MTMPVHTAVGCCSSPEELVRGSGTAGQRLQLVGCSAGELAAETCQEDGCALCRVSVLVTKAVLGWTQGQSRLQPEDCSVCLFKLTHKMLLHPILWLFIHPWGCCIWLFLQC